MFSEQVIGVTRQGCGMTLAKEQMGPRKGKHSKFASDILPHARELARIKRQAETLGMFTNDRELLKCTGCDLAENVSFDGFLMAYQRDCDSLKDCGLRFEALSDNTYRCPVCRTRLKAVML